MSKKKKNTENISREEAIRKHEERLAKMSPSEREAYENRKRAKRRKERRKTIAAIIIEIVLGVIIIVVGGTLVAYTMCGLEEVEVEGSSVYQPDELKELLLDGKYADNCVYDVVTSWFNKKEDVPFIEDYKVKMTGLNSIKIIVNERATFGYVEGIDNKAYYFDEDGVVSDISELKLDKVTLWLDQAPSATEVGDKVVDNDELLGVFLEVAKALKANNIFVNSIMIDEKHSITVMKDNIKITFGTFKDIDEKVKRLNYVLPKLEGKSGTLHLENFAKDNTDIVFKEKK